jgi:hypothetical protein
VRKILRSDETEFSYEREHQPLPKIGPCVEHVDRFLLANAGKPSRERLTLIRIFEDLRALGYEGGNDAVRRFAKAWSQNQGAATAEAHVPLSYAHGEACQFDWSHEIVLIGGVTVTVKVAHVRLCRSRMIFARAYMRERQEPRHRAWTDGEQGLACRRPALCGSTTTNTRCWRQPLGGPSRCMPMPNGS